MPGGPAALVALAVMATNIGWCGSPDNLRAEYRAGQVFVQWDEPEGLTGWYFTALMSREPITEENRGDAIVAGHHIMPGESTDWWLNPETYGKPLSEYPEDKRPEVVVAGWILEEGGERIAPGNGLFVHTVTPQTEGEWYYAVFASGPEDEDGVAPASPIVPGVSSLTQPITQTVAQPQPIWQRDPAEKPAVGAGEGLPLDVPLHAKRGRGGMDWLARRTAVQVRVARDRGRGPGLDHRQALDRPHSREGVRRLQQTHPRDPQLLVGLQ